MSKFFKYLLLNFCFLIPAVLAAQDLPAPAKPDKQRTTVNLNGRNEKTAAQPQELLEAKSLGGKDREEFPVQIETSKDGIEKGQVQKNEGPAHQSAPSPAQTESAAERSARVQECMINMTDALKVGMFPSAAEKLCLRLEGLDPDNPISVPAYKPGKLYAQYLEEKASGLRGKAFYLQKDKLSAHSDWGGEYIPVGIGAVLLIIGAGLWAGSVAGWLPTLIVGSLVAGIPLLVMAIAAIYCAAHNNANEKEAQTLESEAEKLELQAIEIRETLESEPASSDRPS